LGAGVLSEELVTWMTPLQGKSSEVTPSQAPLDVSPTRDNYRGQGGWIRCWWAGIRAFLNDPPGGSSLRAGKRLLADPPPTPSLAGLDPPRGGVGSALRKALRPTPGAPRGPTTTTMTRHGAQRAANATGEVPEGAPVACELEVRGGPGGGRRTRESVRIRHLKTV